MSIYLHVYVYMVYKYADFFASFPYIFFLFQVGFS